MLAASGALNPKQGGPSVIVPIDKELVNALYKPSQWAVTADPAEHSRRSVYLIAKRAGHVFGLDGWLEQTPFMARHPSLRPLTS